MESQVSLKILISGLILKTFTHVPKRPNERTVRRTVFQNSVPSFENSVDPDMKTAD